MALFRELRPGDTLRIGDSTIVAERKNGQVMRLRIDTTLPIHQTKAGSVPAAPSRAPAVKAVAETAPRPTLFRSAKAG